MARTSTRVVLNRKAADQVDLAIADGFTEVAKEVLLVSDPPDATPFGEGLVDRGGYLTYVGDKKVGGGSTGGKQPRKPRVFRVRGSQQIATVVGFGFPGRFQETGAIQHPPQPFFMPARRRVEPKMLSIIARASKFRIARLMRARG